MAVEVVSRRSLLEFVSFHGSTDVSHYSIRQLSLLIRRCDFRVRLICISHNRVSGCVLYDCLSRSYYHVIGDTPQLRYFL